MNALAGLRVLVVEDEPIVAMMLEDMLVELSCTVVGVASTVAQGLALAREGGFDAAVLDININGQRSDPIAEALDRMGLPYVFATGYGSAGLPVGVRKPVIQKPYTSGQLTTALGGILPPA